MLGMKKLNKKSLVKGVINVLESVADARTPEQEIAKKFSSSVMKDDNIIFVIRSFKTRFDMGIVDATIEPIVEPGTLTIKQWALVVHNQPIIVGDGASDVVKQMTRLILDDDRDALLAMKNKLDKAIG